MTLKKYNSKRNFFSTKEPKGKEQHSNKLRFVIQHHFARKEHFDFRFEHNGVLVSFAVPKGLPSKINDKHLAVHVEDHPVDYINFKGTIPKGNYGAGTVEIFDKGTYKPKIDINEGFKKGHLKLELKGKKHKGVWSLVKTEEPNWLIIKNDETKEKKFIEKHTKNPFNKCNVKLAKLTNNIPKKDYLFEIKYDGYRIISFVDKKIKLVSRNNIDYTQKFTSIAKSLKSIHSSAILDGEIVVFDKKGKSDFGLLNQSIKANKQNFCYVVFDIIALEGKDLRNKPLIERKEILNKTLIDCPKNIVLSSFVKNEGEKIFKIAKQLGLEGIVAKKTNSVYNDKRDDDWLKIKCYKRQEFVIGGYSTTNKNKLLSAIYVGYYKNSKLHFVGKVGTGFDESSKKALNKKFEKLKRKTSPFVNFDDKNAMWISPTLVAEIQFAEFTKSNVLRQPSFVGLRTDKTAKKVKLEIADE